MGLEVAWIINFLQLVKNSCLALLVIGIAILILVAIGLIRAHKARKGVTNEQN